MVICRRLTSLVVRLGMSLPHDRITTISTAPCAIASLTSTGVSTVSTTCYRMDSCRRSMTFCLAAAAINATRLARRPPMAKMLLSRHGSVTICKSLLTGLGCIALLAMLLATPTHYHYDNQETSESDHGHCHSSACSHSAPESSSGETTSESQSCSLCIVIAAFSASAESPLTDLAVSQLPPTPIGTATSAATSIDGSQLPGLRAPPFSA